MRHLFCLFFFIASSLLLYVYLVFRRTIQTTNIQFHCVDVNCT